MMVATVPIIAPIVFKAEYDPIWFGILIVILMETAIRSPGGSSGNSAFRSTTPSLRRCGARCAPPEQSPTASQAGAAPIS